MTNKKAEKKVASTPSVLLVGNKAVMNYVLYTINQMKEAKEIVVKARGNSISKAVDVVEILRRRFISTLKVKNIELGTVEVEDKERNRKRNISTLEITFSK